MIKFFREWYKMISNIDEYQMKQEKSKLVDILIFIFTFVLFGIPFLILFYNCFMVYSSKTLLFHIVLWLIPLYGNFVFGLGYMFYYQVLVCMYPNFELLRKTNSKKMFFGGLINPFTFILFILLCIILEVLI